MTLVAKVELPVAIAHAVISIGLHDKRISPRRGAVDAD
jgi:hypothetical protein